MGNVRQLHIKNAAKEIIEKYPNLVSKDFNLNKDLLDEYYEIGSKKIRNRIAGYIVILLKTEKNNYESVRLSKADANKNRKRNDKK